MSQALLGGIDVFHLQNDGDMRAHGLAGNHCAFALTLAHRIDERRLDARLANAARLVPELSFRLARFPRPRWVVVNGREGPRVRVRPIDDGPDVVLSALEGMLEERVDGEHPWAIDILRESSRDTLVLRWFHPLVDGKGAERWLTWLGSGEGDTPLPPAPVEERYETSERLVRKLDRDTRITLARAYAAQMTTLGKVPIISLATASPNASPGQQRVLRVTLSEDETKAFDRRVRERAKLAETSVMVLSAARILEAALLRRGFSPQQHLVPVPLSLDPKIGSGRLFGNHLTMMMLAITNGDLRDEARGIAHIAEQQRDVVRKKLDLGMASALDLAGWLPRPAYRWLATRPFGGESASMIASNPGAVAIASFAGVPVVDAFPLPAVVRSPGFQVIFTRFAGRLSALLVYLDGVIGLNEARAMGKTLRAELTETSRTA